MQRRWHFEKFPGFIAQSIGRKGLQNTTTRLSTEEVLVEPMSIGKSFQTASAADSDDVRLTNRALANGDLISLVSSLINSFVFLDLRH